MRLVVAFADGCKQRRIIGGQKGTSMTKFNTVYPEMEGKVLTTMYENPQMSYDTFSLTTKISGLNVGSPEFEGKFKEVLKATEQLVVKGLVDGDLLPHTYGTY